VSCVAIKRDAEMMTPRPERDWSGKLQAGATREAVSLVEMVLSID